MDLWLIITLGVAVVLAFAFLGHQADRRKLRVLFNHLAAEYGGRVKPGGVLYLPQLHFTRDGHDVLVGGMPNSGSEGSGPFTFVHLDLPVDVGQKLSVARAFLGLGKAVGKLAGLVGGAMGVMVVVDTGDPAFEAAFTTRASDEGFAAALLSADLRAKLLAIDAPGLSLGLDGSVIRIHRDKVADQKSDFDALIALALMAADGCVRGRGN